MSPTKKHSVVTTRSSRGIGLIELMIAVTIGMVLIAGAINIFISGRNTYTTNQQLARLMETGEYALDELTNSVTLTGFWGMSTQAALVRAPAGAPVVCQVSWAYDLANPIQGFDDVTASPFTPCLPNARLQNGTDILVVRHGDAVRETPGAALDATVVYLHSTPTGTTVAQGGTALGTGVGNDVAGGSHRLRAIAYYVAPFSLSIGDGIPSLRRMELEPGPQITSNSPPANTEIVAAGVQDMQIQYGFDTNGDGSANQYVTASYVPTGTNPALDWTQIVAVRIWLILRAETAESGYTNNNTYQLPDGPYTAPGDRFRRLLLTRTVHLRNRTT